MKKIIEHITADYGWTGGVLGLSAPILGCYLYYLAVFSNSMSFNSFLEFVSTPNLAAKVASLSVIINLPLFFIMLHFKKDSNARFVLFATFIWAGLIFYLKLFA